MAIVHDDIGRRRFLSQAVMGFGMLFGMGTLGFRFLQFLLPTEARRESETVLIGAESRIPLGEAVPMDLGGHKILVLRTEDGVAAFSRRCTDLGCLVSWNKERSAVHLPLPSGNLRPHRSEHCRTSSPAAGPVADRQTRRAVVREYSGDVARRELITYPKVNAWHRLSPRM